MVHLVASLFLIFSLPLHASECVQNDTDAKRTVERINERYDDFFRVQRARRERESRMESSKENLREKRLARERELELARREFIKNRRPKPDDTHLQVQFEAQLKERERKREGLRECYVKNRNAAEQILKRGRSIPGLVEFGLEDY